MALRPSGAAALLSVALHATLAGAQVPAAVIITPPSSPAATAQPDGDARLSLEDVLSAVLGAHPELRAAEARARAADQRPVQERSLPDPMVSTGYDSAGRPYPGAGLGSDPNASIGVMVSQELPLAGKRAARALVMSREADAERQQVDAARLGLVARVKQAYYRLSAAWQLDDILRANEELLTTLVKVSETRYAVGQAAQQDVIRAQTQVSVLALQRERLGRERRVREGELNALMGRAPGTPVGRPAALVALDIDVPLERLVQVATSGSPVLRREALLASRSEAAVDVARREFRPDVAVAAGYRFMGEMPDMFEVRFDVTVPLQRARRRAAVAERDLLLAADRHALAGATLSLQARVQEEHETLRTATRLATLFRAAVLPQAQLALESSVNSYQTGSVDFLSVLTNFGAVLEYEMAYVEQLADQYTAASRLEELAATTLLP